MISWESGRRNDCASASPIRCSRFSNSSNRWAILSVAAAARSRSGAPYRPYRRRQVLSAAIVSRRRAAMQPTVACTRGSVIDRGAEVYLDICNTTVRPESIERLIEQGYLRAANKAPGDSKHLLLATD